MKTEELKKTIEKISDFACKEENRNAVGVILDRLIRILRKALPQTLTGDITVGFEDPYYTGKALEVMAVFYPVFKDMDVTPVFNKDEFHCNAEFEGKVRLINIVWHAAHIWFNKDFRRSDLWQKIQKQI